MIAHRFFAGLIALMALGLSIYNVAVAPTGGSIGMTLRQRDGVVRAVVVRGGPAARAGIVAGDVIDYRSTSLDARIAAAGLLSHAGDTYHFPIVRNGITTIAGVTAQRSGSVSRPGLLADLGLAILYTAFCLLVIARAPPGRISTLLAWVLAIAATSDAIADFQFTAPTIYGAFFIGAVAQFAVIGAMQALLIAIICELPVGTPTLRRRLMRLIPVLALLTYGDLPVLVLSVAWPVFTTPVLFDALTWISIAYDLVAAVALLSLAGTAPAEERVRVRWFISTIALCIFFIPALFAYNDAFVHNEEFGVASYYLSSFAFVGPVYATLRHQLVDLDVVLSRSAVYGIISLAIVLIFLALEWAANTLAESQVSESHWGDAARLASFAIAMVVGLSMRPLHKRIESVVNGVIFRDRLRKLHLLQSFARESDLIESRRVLIDLTFGAVYDSLETPGVALYIGDGQSYARERSTDDAMPARLDRGDRLVLQLLERSSPFVSDVATLQGWLIVPLRVRTEVVGFIACGRKRDRTQYLGEEREALDRVAHHVATSYALLEPGT
ncbi:MAG TPA: GAF domain-containing protein [Candidatus Acidoferrales bacterium]|nr:GAF domain-containing protein [Candidatus Acidoferrales bacterium]